MHRVAGRVLIKSMVKYVSVCTILADPEHGTRERWCLLMALLVVNKHTHTQLHSHTLTHSHTSTHSHTFTYTHTHIHINAHIHTHAFTYT